MTVDWTRWMFLTDEEKQARMRRYREIVKAESEEARFTRYSRMDEAIRRAGRLA